MNLANKTKILIALLIIMIFILGMVAFLRPRVSEKAPIPAPSPSSSSRMFIPVPSLNPVYSPTPSNSPVPSKLDKKRLIEAAPIITDKFNIEYFDFNDTFWITIKEDPFNKNQEEASAWLKQRGLNPEELNIKWNRYPGVK